MPIDAFDVILPIYIMCSHTIFMDLNTRPEVYRELGIIVSTCIAMCVWTKMPTVFILLRSRDATRDINTLVAVIE